MHDAEVIVAGGGPGGSALAAALAKAGRDVLLLDKAQFPRHKACSDYINPGGVQLLQEMGMLNELIAAGAHRMDAMSVHAPGGRMFQADFAKAEPGRAALGLSRRRLDHLLLDRARAAGAIVREQAHVRSVMQQDGRVIGVEATIDGVREIIHAPVVVGADGRNSIVARSLGLSAPQLWPKRTGLVAHYRGVTGLDAFGEMHIGRGLYVGLAPIEDGLTNVAVVAGDRGVGERTGTVEQFFEDALGSLPAVAWKLEGATRSEGIRGVGAMACRARRTTGDGFALVGDAASFLDPFTGEGVFEALLSANLAAPVIDAALRAGDASAAALDPYRLARRRAFTAKRQVCWIVQGVIHSPPLMNYVADRLERRDDLRLTMSGVLGNFRPATEALSPVFLARLLRP